MVQRASQCGRYTFGVLKLESTFAVVLNNFSLSSRFRAMSPASASVSGASASVFAPELPVSLENSAVPCSPDVQAEHADIIVVP